MDERIADLYKVPNVEQYEDLHLLSLSETCAVLEEKVLKILQTLPENKRQIIQAYIYARDDLEVESVKTALRWGKHNYKIAGSPADSKE